MRGLVCLGAALLAGGVRDTLTVGSCDTEGWIVFSLGFCCGFIGSPLS